jgi:hypothetical protein
MRNRLILLLVMLPLMIFSQKGITLKIEDLPKPDHLLQLNAYNDIYKNLILRDLYLEKYQLKRSNIDFKYNIVARSKAPDSLVSFGYHSFFNGMYQAYAQHRPYVLSPDMIWLLISQGFAQHVNAHSDELRNQFVNFDGKLTLLVNNNKILLDDPKSPWEEVFPEFSKQISEYTGKDLMKALTCDFTTTTPVSKVASEITIMEAMKPYFEYVVIRMVCGIPEIKLEGTTADWQKVLDKARYLRKYKLDWWIDEIEPLLEKFVSASKGDYEKDFWCNIFKVHSVKVYGAPDKVDGWIVKFFPYDKTGKRNDLKELNLGDNLPSEIVKVDLKYIEIDGAGNATTTPLELWAGFVGLQQNPGTFALKPEIGWMIKKKEIGKEGKDAQQLTDELRAKSYNSVNNGGIEIRVFRVPKEILSLDQIKGLSINFTDEIIIPDEMGKIKIEEFRMYGKISDEGIDRIVKLFPNTMLIINNKRYIPKKQ